MVRTTKRERKYKKKPEAEVETIVKKKSKKKQVSNEIYKVLINGANFLKKTYATPEEAESAAQEFCKGSNSTYMIVGGKK